MFDDYQIQINETTLLYHTKKRRIIQFLSAAVLFFLLTGNILMVSKVKGQNQNEKTTLDIVALTNLERNKLSLAPLIANVQLTTAAQKKAEHILAEQYFSHNSLDGEKFSTWVKEENYRYLVVGENLAMGFNSAEEVLNAWMNSPLHKENILNPRYRDIGIGIIRGQMNGKETEIIVQYFGVTANSMISENLRGENTGNRQSFIALT